VWSAALLRPFEVLQGALHVLQALLHPLLHPRYLRTVGGDGKNKTLSMVDDAHDGGSALECPYLFLVLEAHHLAAPAARFALAAFDEIVLGRGDERSIEQATDAGGRRVATVRINDPWMSSTHARFVRALGRWVVEDAGSKNGSLRNGAPVRRAALSDGDVIELGHTFILFRAAQRFEVGEPTVLDMAASSSPAPGLVTLSPDLAREIKKLESVARSTVPVILEGETGTGKEVAARAIHALSGRRGDFVAVNCGALPATLVEGELFGHRRGAFSGASDDRPGLIRAADTGTLLLDEIGELPAQAQAVLLRVLEAREVLPIGATRPVPVDIRVIAATHRGLDRMVEEGTFRRDLHARIAGYRLRLPPLRERIEDLGLLSGALLARIAPEAADRAALQPKAARALLGCGWPGNIRQLEKCLSAAMALAGKGAITLEHLPEAVRFKAPESPGKDPRGERDEEDESEASDELRERLVALLREHQGNVSAIARATGKARMQVQRWLKRYALDPTRFRG
jgi:transcriptional regulator with PAS, ATPase and Fis domain